jgi:hypothetical protein
VLAAQKDEMLKGGISWNSRAERDTKVDDAHRMTPASENSHKGGRSLGDGDAGLHGQDLGDIAQRNTIPFSSRSADEHRGSWSGGRGFDELPCG